MKNFFCIALSLLILSSCRDNPTTTSSDVSVQETSSTSIVETSSEDISQITSSQEEGFEFLTGAKEAAEKIREDVLLFADTVLLDSRFILEKTGISEDMYLDFYGETSFETADNSFIAVFCCSTADKVEKLKQKLSEALADDDKLSYLSESANVFSADGYVVLIATQNNFDEEYLVSKLIQ